MAAVSRLMFRRPTGALLAAALMLGGVFAVNDAGPAAAQGWFGGLFGGGPPPQGPYWAPQYPGYRDRPDRPARRHVVRRRAPPVAEQAEETAAKPKVPQKTATIFVDVFGDSLGQLLANGLDDALADKAEVGVVHLARGPSGLVNEGYYDWPKTIDDLLAHQARPGPVKAALDKSTETTSGPAKAAPDDQAAGKGARIDVAVMMIGSNDRQPIIQDGKKIEAGSDAWTALYRKRVMAIAEAFQKKKIPLVWVGVPIVKNDDFADDMAALNDIYRDAAARTGAAYVDTWEAFADDNGDFAAYGPDVDGQTVRLRSADGIYFTKAGARKLAHFVEGQVRRDLDGKTPLPELPTADAPAADAKDLGKDPGKAGKPAVALVKPEAGPIKNLGEPAAAKDGHLAEVAQAKAAATLDPTVVNALVKGQPDPAPAGRADDFRWPPAGAPAQ